jgi:hypothetical protein
MELGPFTVGDRPVNPIKVYIESEEQLASYTEAAAALRNAEGVTVALFAPMPIEDGVVTFYWPDADLFTTSGIYVLSVNLLGDFDTVLRLDPIQMVVEAHTGWHTLATARSQWANALDDVQLYTLLEIAKEQCVTYAPSYLGTPPLRFKQAQLMQARNILNAAKTDPATGADGELYVIRPYPMDSFIRELLRPRKGVPLVG